MKLMANAAKGLMLAAFMAVGTTTVNAQENSEETTYKPVTVGNWVKGEEVKGNGQEVYIYNVGAGTFITDSKYLQQRQTSPRLLFGRLVEIVIIHLPVEITNCIWLASLVG